ncbi:MAG: hypothetical protein JWM72_3113 [Actinomycetia bacterium]|jgi:uncharacterized protein (TIGR03083 family)|nr:hypothetical protein [Actinomycetes bacterium]MDQ1461721.1 hypothetical protein [Actinomycetota bacterium]
MPDRLQALKSSSAHLRSIVEPLRDEQIVAPSYASEWTIADVLSHLGSSAVIMGARLDAGLAGTQPADDFAAPVWDQWNAKSPAAKVADGLAADRAYLERLDAVTAAERAAFHVTLGPMQLDFDGLVGTRLNEHALHTWDIEVMFDPSAPVAPDATALIIDNIAMIVGFTGKPTGAERVLHVRTTEPARDFALAVGKERMSLEPDTGDRAPDLELPAEAFIRLVYGRLDPDHTPSVRGSADLDELRRMFPGV